MTSYQKLKKKNKDLEAELWRVKMIIHENDFKKLHEIRTEVQLTLDMTEAWWQGDRDAAANKMYGGIYPMMDKK